MVPLLIIGLQERDNMDIMDIMLAKALTGSGASSDGTAARAAQQAIAAAQQAQAAVANVKTEEEIAAIADTEVKKVTLASFNENASPTYNFKRIDLNFPDGTKVSTRPVRLYH
jgi:type II secretory pathway pseudopilin PulG